MNITRDNYELFCLRYMEGELPAAERSEVERFLDENPDLKAEVALYDPELKLSDLPAMPCPNKESLRRGFAWPAWATAAAASAAVVLAVGGTLLMQHRTPAGATDPVVAQNDAEGPMKGDETLVLPAESSMPASSITGHRNEAPMVAQLTPRAAAQEADGEGETAAMTEAVSDIISLPVEGAAGPLIAELCAKSGADCELVADRELGADRESGADRELVQRPAMRYTDQLITFVDTPQKKEMSPQVQRIDALAEQSCRIMGNLTAMAEVPRDFIASAKRIIHQ